MDLDSLTGGGGGGSNEFAFSLIIFALAISLLMPVFIGIFLPQNVTEGNEFQDSIDELNEGYGSFVGAAPASETVWGLTGIYTPYLGGSYGYTADGWLYGEKITSYNPSQYRGTPMDFTVNYDEPVYTYVIPDNPQGNPQTSFDGHKDGDVFTDVVMDKSQQSDVFFTSSGKHTEGNQFYYEFSGYRYAFQPLGNYTTLDQDGHEIPVVANTTSLSLIWYNYYESSGVAGQLILTGSDSGVGYLTAEQVVRAFDSTTNTAKFPMTFNNINMNVYIKINPYYTSQGYSVADCYNNGYWSLMVTSLSTNTDAYVGADFSFNIYEIINVMIDLFTFNMADYGLSGVGALLASLVVVVPLYAGLIAIGLTCYPVLILAQLMMLAQAIASVIQHWRL